ncbi:hypothetical protein CEUSTIGMA_g4016.t1 [Chlamydomonas eustigma]|uniref:ubiquitinyl hydrolase 1 n=1 Tax=Chlamydomonas eustigma TaxID=1157962 RepID=A0A250X1F4_9CHLO|nr:hypothetical protein CEUSTIGMA_g4016.t1 [Chlamydomonas eustigma]|eukprot:GAX76570.1 hypothetical protein CEUSTIGMA_g4016.t1 [Chlamydomonas eustigma]
MSPMPAEVEGSFEGHAGNGKSSFCCLPAYTSYLENSIDQPSPVTGMKNLGSTCYLNAAFQLLMACSPFVHEIVKLHKSPQHDSHFGKGPLSYTVKEAVLCMSGAKGPTLNPVYNPQALLSAVMRHAQHLKSRQQQDCHELLHILLEGLQEEEMRSRQMAVRLAAKAVQLGKDCSAPTDAVAPAVHPVQKQGADVTSVSNQGFGGFDMHLSSMKKNNTAMQQAPKPGKTAMQQAPNPRPNGKIELPMEQLASSDSCTIVDRVFGGKLTSVILCSCCGNMQVNEESLLDLSLPLSQGNLTEAGNSMQQQQQQQQQRTWQVQQMRAKDTAFLWDRTVHENKAVLDTAFLWSKEVTSRLSDQLDVHAREAVQQQQQEQELSASMACTASDVHKSSPLVPQDNRSSRRFTKNSSYAWKALSSPNTTPTFYHAMKSQASWSAQPSCSWSAQPSCSWSVPTGQRTCLSAEFQLTTSDGEVKACASTTAAADAQPLTFEKAIGSNRSPQTTTVSHCFEVADQHHHTCNEAGLGTSFSSDQGSETGTRRVQKRLCGPSNLTVQLEGHQRQQDAHLQDEVAFNNPEPLFGGGVRKSVSMRSGLLREDQSAAIQVCNLNECLKEFLRPEPVHWACPRARSMSVPVPIGGSSENGAVDLCRRSASFKKQVSWSERQSVVYIPPSTSGPGRPSSPAPRRGSSQQGCTGALSLVGLPDPSTDALSLVGLPDPSVTMRIGAGCSTDAVVLESVERDLHDSLDVRKARSKVSVVDKQQEASSSREASCEAASSAEEGDDVFEMEDFSSEMHRRSHVSALIMTLQSSSRTAGSGHDFSSFKQLRSDVSGLRSDVSGSSLPSDYQGIMAAPGTSHNSSCHSISRRLLTRCSSLPVRGALKKTGHYSSGTASPGCLAAGPSGSLDGTGPAKKMYCLSEVPAALLLHLKRFNCTSATQVAVGMDKLDVHVAFDAVMKVEVMRHVAPACTDQTNQQQHHEAFTGSPLQDRHGCSTLERVDHATYSLVGVVEHVGCLQSGHYVAYVLRSQPDVVDTGNDRQMPTSTSGAVHHDSIEIGSYGGGGGDIRVDVASQPAIKALSSGVAGERRWYRISDASVKGVTWEEVCAAQAYMLLYERT